MHFSPVKRSPQTIDMRDLGGDPDIDENYQRDSRGKGSYLGNWDRSTVE